VPDYFEVFGIPRRFAIDRAALEKRFYELSREAHPDRFAGAGADALRQSLERMSLLNEAYRVLKQPEELRAYFLRLEGFDAGTGTGLSAQAHGSQKAQQIPAELAESWFELQDSVMEEPGAAAERIAAFERELGELRERDLAALGETEHRIDAALSAGALSAPRELLEELSRGIRSLSYLASMGRDVQRLRDRLAGAAAGLSGGAR
jgi:molecular chaperone HscB